MTQKTVNYLIGVAALLGILWQGAEKWFDLQYRVKRLEETTTFIHGNVDAFLPKEP